VSDYWAVPALLDMPVAKPKALLADKGYDGDAIREDLLWRGVLPIIPPKANRRDPAACDFRRYRDRNQVEPLFNRLKQSRRIATRYDKTASSFLGFLSLAAGKLWLTDYVNKSYLQTCRAIAGLIGDQLCFFAPV
jgi:transposase